MKSSLYNILDIREYNQYSLYSLFLDTPINGNTCIRSPFRNDQRPSFSIYYNEKKEKVYWKDFGTGDFGDIADFAILYYFHKTGEIIHRAEAFHRIKGLIETEASEDSLKIAPDYTVSNTLIEYSVKSFSQEELNWWDSFGIFEETLKDFSVRSVDYLAINGEVRARSGKDNPIYAYPIGNYNKIYQPFNKKYKWRNNYPKNYIEGMVQLLKRKPKTDFCIVTKSLKDVMVLTQYGYDAVALKSESTMIEEKQHGLLKERYNTIYSFMDNDDAGNFMAYKLNEKYDMPMVMLTGNSKDISDFNKTNRYLCQQWLKRTFPNK